ncbi:uncharacterized protein [Clinocottus analis]|uniref:uncharacterized protein n=1 Tax=Clinocottus analis TaxID=304258 RepID=UPI0035C01CAE
MKNFTLMTALSLCSFSWMCVSGSEFQTVDVQSGGEVTLLCSNFSSTPSQIMWFRVVKRSRPSSIASIYNSFEKANFSKGKFEIRSNSSVVFLTIKQVNASDSGLYFCGFYLSRNPVIYNATYLEVHVFLVEAIVAGVTLLLVSVIIGLSVKVRKLQKALAEKQKPHQTTSRSSDELNYAAVTFHPKAKRNQQPAAEKEEETTAIYSATR